MDKRQTDTIHDVFIHHSHCQMMTTVFANVQGNLLHATQTSAMSDDPRHLAPEDGSEGLVTLNGQLQRESSTFIPGSRAGWARAHRCV